MAKYKMEVTVEAEQFLPEEDKIPKGVMSDGPRAPKDDKRSSWILKTDDGTSYLKPGDYVITTSTDSRYIMRSDIFELNYKLVEG